MSKSYWDQLGVSAEFAREHILGHLDQKKYLFDLFKKYRIDSDLVEALFSLSDGSVEAFFADTDLDVAEIDRWAIRSLEFAGRITYQLKISQLESPDVNNGDRHHYQLLDSGDLNNDGFDDILLGVHAWNDNFDRTIPYTFSRSKPIAAIFNPRTELFEVNGLIQDQLPYVFYTHNAEIDDFNRDGFNDLFLVGTGPDQALYSGERPYLIMGSPEGLVDSSDLPPLSMYTHNYAVGDFNGDQLVDFYLGNSQTVATLGNDADSRKTKIDKVPAVDFMKDPATNKSYLMMSNSSKVGVQWADAQFDSSLLFPYDNFQAASAVASDLNGDGYDDLIVGANNFSDYAGSIGIFLNQQGNGFEEPSFWSTPELSDANYTISALAVEDLDQDGTAEIILQAVEHQGPAIPYSGLKLLVFSQDDQLGGWRENTAEFLSIWDFRDLDPQNHVADFNFADLDFNGELDMILDMHKGYSSSGYVPRIWLNENGVLSPIERSMIDLNGGIFNGRLAHAHPLPVGDEVVIVGVQENWLGSDAIGILIAKG